MSDLKTAVSLIKAGQLTRARLILVELLKQDENSEGAWLWMTKTDIPDSRKIDCLKRVLEINPNNDKAQQQLEILEAKHSRDLLLDEFTAVPTPAAAPPKKKSKFPVGLVILMATAALFTVVCICPFLASFSGSSGSRSVPARIAPAAPSGPTSTPTIVQFKGSGDDVVQFRAEQSGMAFAALSYRGSSNFIVRPYSPSGRRMSSIVNDIGDYDGETVLTIEEPGLHTLDIQADGNWAITLQLP